MITVDLPILIRFSGERKSFSSLLIRTFLRDSPVACTPQIFDLIPTPSKHIQVVDNNVA